jgi:hypothetical protein
LWPSATRGATGFGIEAGVQLTVRSHPRDAVARRERAHVIGLEHGEFAAEQHLAIRLHRDAADVFSAPGEIQIGIKAVQHASRSHPHDAQARHARNRKRPAAD